MGVVAPSPGIFAARIGAINPVILFRKLATPVPAPLTGAGKISGVNAYSTPYMMFCENAATQENASWAVGVFPNITKRKRNMADTRVEPAKVPRRPKKGDGESTRYAASTLPGTPMIEVMA
uniref:Uncharacterized protein n=1 Tax=Photinus pyralis TaxID=7054 RepID=A0A1Y1KSL5_PHOPY